MFNDNNEIQCCELLINLPHETETKTNYCETGTETKTKKVVSRPRWSRDLNIPAKYGIDILYDCICVYMCISISSILFCI